MAVGDSPPTTSRTAGRAADREGGPGWAPVGLFFAANVLFGAGLYFHAFLYNFYLQGVGHGEDVMGIAAAAISAGGLLGLVPAGLAVDRLGIRSAYLAAVGVAAVGLAAGAVAENASLVYVAAALSGAGAAGWRVAMGPAILRLTTAGIRARAFSWNTALLVGSGAAWTGGAGASASALEAWLELDPVGGLRGALLLGALATATAGLLAPLALRSTAGAAQTGPEPGDAAEPKAERRSEATSRAPTAAGTVPRPGWRARLGGLAIPRRLALLILGVGVFWTAGALALPFYNIYFQRAHGLDIARIGWILGAGQALTAVAVFASGEGAARFGPRPVLTAWLLLLPPALWGLALASGTGAAITFFLLQAFVLPAVYPLVDQLVLERAPADRHGAVSGWRNVATEGSGLLGATLGGYLLATLPFPVLFGLGGAVAATGGAATILLLRRHPGD